MSINRYLEETASKLIIKGNEKESIDVSLNTFKDRMRDYFSKNESVNLKEIKVFGSYQRDTNLPQSVDYGTDVDIMLVMDNDGSTPQTYLDRVRRGVEAKYSTSQIRQSSPTVVLQMLHIKFEITPAIMDSGLYRIKNNRNEWIYTFCATDFSNLTIANKNNHYMIKPLLRLLKYWNVSKNYKAFSSYELEKIMVNYYQPSQYQGYDLKKYLLTGMNELYKLSTCNYQKERLDNKLKDWYTPGVDEKDILDGILACQRENFWWDVGLRKRFKYASITLISILFVAILAMGLWKNEEITELLCRLAFVIPMIKWLLLDTVKKLNKDISILQELDGDINNNEMKTMEDLQDIQKVIFQHRKGCYAIPEIIYNIFKDNDEDRAYREARM